MYLRFRHYDPTSAHFGVQDTYLGNTFNPASLNRYLFCESDPINNIDPSGHITLKQRYELDKKQYGKTITNSRAYQLKQKRKQFSRAAARWVNGWLGQVTERLYTAAGRPVPSVKAWSNAGRRTDWAGAAQRLQRQYRELYCGLGRPYLSNDARTAQNHLTFDVLGFIIPVIPDAVNALIYTAEGDKEEASFSAVFALASLSGPIGKGAAKGIHIGSGIVKGSAKAVKSGKEVYLGLQQAGKVSSVAKMQGNVSAGKAPKSIQGVHSAHESTAEHSKPHVHFSDGTAMNYDGTLHDKGKGVHTLTNAEKKWLEEHGWATEIKEQ